MKKSNIALLCLALFFTTGMITTGFVLKKEAAKIDLNDPLRSYETSKIASFKVLKISGSNGYPIHLQQDTANSLTVLRRRKGFLKTNRIGDTLDIIFSGANIPLDEADKTTTPAGIIIKTNSLVKVLNQNTFTRIIGFRNNSLDVNLAGNAVTTFSNCKFPTLSLQANGNSRFGFEELNTTDTLRLKLQNATVAFLKNINFSALKHQIGDSAAVVLSNQTLTQMSSPKNKEPR